MEDFKELRVSIDGHVAILTLNNPPVNALSKTLSEELTLALDRISETPEIRAVVLTGEGKVFCAGADLKGRAAVIKGPGDLPQHSRRTRECFHAIRECTKPVIAAINGAALEVARAIASKSPLSSQLAKQTLNVIEELSLRDGYRYEQDMTAAIAKTEDAKEAQRAFAEKRAPVFKGR